MAMNRDSFALQVVVALIVWVVAGVLCCVILFSSLGCSTENRNRRDCYPFDEMLDPVTEEVPNVIE